MTGLWLDRIFSSSVCLQITSSSTEVWLYNNVHSFVIFIPIILSILGVFLISVTVLFCTNLSGTLQRAPSVGRSLLRKVSLYSKTTSQSTEGTVCNNLAPNNTDFMKQIHVHIDTSKVLELLLYMYSVCYLAVLLYMCINYNMFRK